MLFFPSLNVYIEITLNSIHRSSKSRSCSVHVFLINKICSKSSGKWYKIEISNNKKKENRIELIEGNFTFHTYNIIGKNYNNLLYEDL